MILTAIPVGFFSGLFGIGGGLISVPFLYYLFSSFGVDQAFIMHLAVGTSFSIIIPTSIVSVMTHHKFRAVDFNIVKSYGIFVIIGVISGTVFAANLNTKPLVLFFTLVVFIGTSEKLNLSFSQHVPYSNEYKPLTCISYKSNNVLFQKKS